MKDRGKRELEAFIGNNGGGDCYEDPNVPDFPCKKHPSSASSSGGFGICAYCLTDRLVQLVCPECGEQRLPHCSCSEEISASATHGETGRISFLLENEKNGLNVASSNSKIDQKTLQGDCNFTPLKRSNSTCVVDVNRRREREGSSTGFWKIGKFFRKKREKRGIPNNNDDHKSESGGFPVSRSRSLCSFRGGFYDMSTEESGGFPVSTSAARASSVSANFHIDSAKRSCFSESEARISNFDYYDASFLGPKQSIFALKESEFMSEDPAFIDLKLNEMSTTKEFGFRGGGGVGEEMLMKNGGGASCRISSVSERELRKCRKSYKVWRWFFRNNNHQHSSRRRDVDEHEFAFKS